MRNLARLDARGAVEMRWVITILLICAAALGGGFLVGFLLGS